MGKYPGFPHGPFPAKESLQPWEPALREPQDRRNPKFRDHSVLVTQALLHQHEFLAHSLTFRHRESPSSLQVRRGLERSTLRASVKARPKGFEAFRA